MNGVLHRHAPATIDGELPEISMIAIGRNEGDRLVRCLESIRAADYPADKLELIYVDTDSSDGSCAAARGLGATVIEIRPNRPCAAIARNAGAQVAKHQLLHFLDGDTILEPAWLRRAAAAMGDISVACVFGRREEIAPMATIYNFWAHHDWYVAPGPAESCAGDACFRRSVFERAGGFDGSLIAGEEPDLCFRIRHEQGGTILSLGRSMTRHDMNMTRFGQYWRRCTRTGHAYASVARRYPKMRRWRVARWRNVVHAVAPLAALMLSLAWRSPWPLALWAALLTVAVLRNATRVHPRVGTWRGAVFYSVHHYIAKMPMAIGQCVYWTRLIFKRRPQPLVEYRGS